MEIPRKLNCGSSAATIGKSVELDIEISKGNWTFFRKAQNNAGFSDTLLAKG